MGQGHGWEGAVLKLLRGKDFVFTVTGAEQVTEHYRRVHLTDGGMLAVTGVHPTMWVRLWFEAAGKPHQRAYTLVDPDPAVGTFSLEFALHEGHASDWARAAKPGDTIEATVHGTGFTDPDPTPSHILAIGDPASLPAINSLLTALPSTPTTIWFETPAESESEEASEAKPEEAAGAKAAAGAEAGTAAGVETGSPDTAASTVEVGRGADTPVPGGTTIAAGDRDREAAPALLLSVPGAGGLPLRLDPSHHDFRPVPRQDAGARLITQVKTDAPALLAGTPAPYVWIACDTATTRSLAAYFRKELGLSKHRVHALGYWRP
ncbi:siderophore-interacting protein [Streptomyces caniscabiei]|uniref:Siderophore-interacting protein n=1 Tax=Streptomyces caniscabiei TaxID=2746961 RepID=A0ABU4N1T4_9ACTN|nr:siderophore-interacting protein [Streptomyces caniscabiei]MBE4740482.1 siderophore-interacting protein [Streptomyces caniscabiei]MBE4761293.1 siderophore-interacting protein [Streptomyces caniscabiei]MBE4773444.1 siderophore-interacting protein [Streptomyces caniscabiei]MBE4790109.1 siderophore-interacting protein [Streptomyces caniscabiei]MBE4799303.1 siderophore-interacting protein [Streptomyces caniscabiei]